LKSNSRKCAVIPSILKDNERISQAVFDVYHPYQSNISCDYSDKLEPEFEFNGEYYCLLHLPIQAGREIVGRNIPREKSNKIDEIIQNYNKLNKPLNFNFIAAENIKIQNAKCDSLYFIGCWLWGIKITNCNDLDEISIQFSKVQGVNEISECSARWIHLRQNLFLSGSDGLVLNKITSDGLSTCDNDFEQKNRIIKTGVNAPQILFENSKIDSFIFNKNNISYILRMYSNDIRRLEMRNNNFYHCPEINLSSFPNDCTSLQLPLKSDIKFDKLISTLKAKRQSLFRKDILNSIIRAIKNPRLFLKKRSQMIQKNSDHWNSQYMFLRGIYNLARERKMYDEQSDYFYLMQKCRARVRGGYK
tara:strand:+ start:1214 stop:2296 length:1083 start_codon:yes stop_codon:yes gene_type:complete